MLALIAGQGRLPALVHARLVGAGHAPVVAELDGFPAGTPVPADITFRLERLSHLFDALRAEGVTEVAFVGRVRRPRLDPGLIDAASAPLFDRVATALRAGDDGALRAILDLFTEAGFAIRPVQDLVPALLPDAGVFGGRDRGEADVKDADRALDVIAAMGAADVGQACAVAEGVVLAVEAAAGTDWMLDSLASRPGDLPPGGLLVKAPKPGQDRRVDLPTIGPGTIRRAAAAGLTGVVVTAGGVLVLDAAEAKAEAARLGLLLWVRAP